MKILVCGDTRWENNALTKVMMQNFKDEYGTDIEIIHSSNKGADSIAKSTSIELNITTKEVHYDNLFDENPDLVVAFTDDIENESSKGAYDTLAIASEKGIPYKIFASSGVPHEINFDETVLLTHTDLDGVGCEILLRKISPSIDVWRVNYGYETNEILMNSLKNYKRIIFTDMSFEEELYDELIIYRSNGTDVLLLDHHQSTLDRFEHIIDDHNWMIVDLERSGTKLVYDYFKPTGLIDEYEDFVDAVNDFDLWIHENDKSIPLQFIWQNYPSIDQFVSRWINNPKLEFTDYEEVLLDSALKKFTDSYIRSLDSIQFGEDIDGKKFALCSFESNFSLIAMELMKELSGKIDYLVGYQYYFKSSLSFRSTDEDIRVDKIAEGFGGGGHILASGSNIPEDMKEVDFYESVKAREWVPKKN